MTMSVGEKHWNLKFFRKYCLMKKIKSPLTPWNMLSAPNPRAHEINLVGEDWHFKKVY